MSIVITASVTGLPHHDAFTPPQIDNEKQEYSIVLYCAGVCDLINTGELHHAAEDVCGIIT
jgi:hypothetical protein